MNNSSPPRSTRRQASQALARRFLVTASVLLLVTLVPASAVFAASTATVAGTVQTINSTGHSFEIFDASQNPYSFSTTSSTVLVETSGKHVPFAFSLLKVGDSVTVAFTTTDKKAVASTVALPIAKATSTANLIKVGNAYLPKGFPKMVPIPAHATIISAVGATVQGATLDVVLAVTSSESALFTNYQKQLTKAGFTIPKNGSGTQTMTKPSMFIDASIPYPPYWIVQANIVTKPNATASIASKLKSNQVELSLYVVAN